MYGTKSDRTSAKNWREDIKAQVAKGGGNAYTAPGSGSAGLAQRARMENRKSSPSGTRPQPGTDRDRDIKGIEAKRRDVNEGMTKSRYNKSQQPSSEYKVQAMKDKLAKGKDKLMRMRPATGK